MQFNHPLLKCQGTMLLLEKAFTTNMESDSNQKFNQFLWKAISMALIAPSNSAWKAETKPRFSEMQSKQSVLESLTIMLLEEVADEELISFVTTYPEHLSYC